MTRARIGMLPAFGAVVVGALLALAPTAGAQAPGNPVIFVHGGFGSAGQFQSQAMRFSTNGYPDSHIAALEYDSLFDVKSLEEVLEDLDDLIAELQASTGAARVDLMGHSLGTRVGQEYLGDPARAANVAHWVNIDGGEADALPGGVPTLALWAGEGDPGRRIVGARNVTLPDQTHVEAATSPEAFAEMFAFLTGREPGTTEIRRAFGPIEISGRAVFFPQNVGVEGATVQIWELYPFDGRRKRSAPEATLEVAPDGSWGPFHGRAGRRYEFVVDRDVERDHRFYFEPFLRSDRFVRLLTDQPGGTFDSLIERGDGHMAITIARYKEFWGDQGRENDALFVNGTNIINAATSPQSNRTIGIFLFDAGSDGITDLSAPDPTIFALPFLTGVDHYVPAEIPTRGTVTVRVRSRGDARPRQIRFPAIASTESAVSVYLRDFEERGAAARPLAVR